MNDKTIITCALPYANGPLHVGHVRSTYLPADIYRRYLELKKKDVAFVCATDEHGTPITISAEKEEKKPIEIAEKYHKEIKKDLDGLNVNFDTFSRTSSETNIKNAQEFFKKADEKDYIYKKEVEQYYCENCDRFLPDRYVEGSCPKCGSEGARGDHCENCGAVLEKLENPRCLICGEAPKLKKTKHWFFKLTAFKDKLKEFLSEKDLAPNVRNYASNWLDKLQDWCITRDLDWGVPVPAENSEGKVLYVWWDAPIGYISATEEWKGEEGLDYWRNGEIVHFIGKDIIYHHTLFWPSMLMAQGDYNLPSKIIAGEYLSLEGKKMSTSRDWVVWISDFLDDYPADYLRYYLTITSSLDTDMDFSWDGFEARVNNELSDVLGNFVHRVLTFNKKFFEGKVPEPGDYDNRDEEIIEEIDETVEKVDSLLDEYKFMESLKAVMGLIQSGNKYLNEKEPWKNEDVKPTVTYLCTSIVKTASILLWPFLPETAEGIRNQLNLEEKPLLNDAEKLVEPGHEIGEPDPLIEKVEIEEEIEFSGKSVKVDTELEKKIENGDLSVALGEVTGITVQTRTGELERMKEDVVEKVGKKDVKKTIDSYRYMLDEIDKGKEGLSSENLHEFAEDSDQLPNINTVADTYNLVSYKTGMIMGAYDVKSINGDVHLKVADGDESFVPIGSKKSAGIKPGEYILVDDKDKVITRWLTKEHEKVKITDYTKGAVICVQGNKDIPQEKVDETLEEVCKLITKFCNGEYKKLYP